MNISKDCKFIITHDENTADELEALGCTLINYENGTYTYLNDSGRMNFSQLEKGTYKFTNRLNM